jgi:hypothetical protein
MFSGGAGANAAHAAEAARGYMGTSGRLRDLLTQAVSSAGWPMVALAAVGTWLVWRKQRRDRLESALLAWAVVWIVLSASTVFSRVDQEFVRYAAEFLGRINLATIPLVAILAAKGAAAGWDDETPLDSNPLRVAVFLIAWALSGLARADRLVLGKVYFLMNVPLRSSSYARLSSASVFITIGPYQATGSSSGRPEASRNRMPCSPA